MNVCFVVGEPTLGNETFITDIAYIILFSGVKLHMILECLSSPEILLGADRTLHHRVGGVGESVDPEELPAGCGVLTVILLATETSKVKLKPQSGN